MDQAEKLRNVIKLKNQQQGTAARVITVTSGKGGVGKSNVTVNLAVQMARMGKKVLIFDADFGLANVEVMFGAIPKHSLADLIYHEKGIREIITEGPLGIGFISAGSGIRGLNNLTREQILYLVKSLKELDELADIILVDTGAGISDSVLEFVMASPEVVLVTTPDPSSLTDSYSLLKTLYRNPAFSRQQTEIRMISNKVASVEEGKSLYDRLNSVVEKFLEGSVDYLGMVPQDTMLERAVRKQTPVSIHLPKAKSSRAFEVLAANLLEHKQNVPKMGWGIARMFSDLINRRQ